MYLTQDLRRAARIRGDHPGLIFEDRTKTWREIENRCARLGAALGALGMQAGDRVAVMALSSDRYIESFYGVPWGGGVIVPLNIRWAAPEMIHALNDSGATILMIDDAHLAQLPRLLENCPAIREVVFLGDPDSAPPDPPQGHSQSLQDFESILAAAEPMPDAMRGYQDLAGIFYTSGTTGKSKGVMLSHANLCGNTLTVIGYMPIDEKTTYLHSMPMFHVSGVSRVYSVTAGAGCHVVATRFEPEAILQLIQKHRITVSVFVPTMLNMILHLPNFADFDLSSLTDIAYGASPMPEALIRETMERIPTARFTQAYGMTELSPVATALLPKDHVVDGPLSKRIKSAGRPVIGADVRIVDENDNEVELGEVGEVVVRGGMVMQGYWQQPELTAATVRDGWMHTGDAGRMDEDGFVYIVDRVKDMIVTGGENVYSAEVENAVYQHPGVKECAVIGVPDEKWVEAVHAIVVPKEGVTITEPEMIAHCREVIAGYKCPRGVTIRTESLPLSGSNKVLKSQLRTEFLENGATPPS